ncbi:hypothetical protein ACIBUY_40300 [Streptomyces sp. NPDC050085]|uniref:hypothetical protein n=1 Tax=Streptomyces sp. NPDC050085 TaxID=3365600 RepID=UPI0037A5E02C
MIHWSRDAAGVSRPRLLPWSNLEGNPCYPVTDETGTSHLSRIADNVESVQLSMAGDLLDHAADLLGGRAATMPQLRFFAARLTESLHDVKRIAHSRGARLLVPDSDDETLGETPEDHSDHSDHSDH